MIAAGTKTEKMLPDTFYEMAVVYYGRDDAAWLYPHNLLQWSDKIQAQDALGSLDEIEDMVMINTCSLMLRGLGHYLQQPRNLATAWGPYAQRALKEKGMLEDVEEEIRTWHTS